MTNTHPLSFTDRVMGFFKNENITFRDSSGKNRIEMSQKLAIGPDFGYY
ncbi:hypothetical protein [Cyclobacterium plantarum]|uniref:Uncharacterized protein n=1 Tax=Cyclobacterium plantarum TaxID=2716263 RepID=A0ABX0H5Y4_9BACT|nr:hypothetical protein [Cyclobacterium plantarum]NHE56845.1 hypothetical protein [Cyclobacterium plantarum]